MSSPTLSWLCCATRGNCSPASALLCSLLPLRVPGPTSACLRSAHAYILGKYFSRGPYIFLRLTSVSAAVSPRTTPSFLCLGAGAVSVLAVSAVSSLTNHGSVL